jgi:hypothetical protein
MDSGVQIDVTVVVSSYKLIKVIIICIKMHIIIYMLNLIKFMDF